MTTREASELDRAINRATANGVEVLAKGSRKSDGARAFCVPSQSHPGLWQLVALVGKRRVCDCEAGKHGRICVHRASVHMYLTVEASRRQERAEAVEAALREAEREMRETAPLLRDNRPFSIFAPERPRAQARVRETM